MIKLTSWNVNGIRAAEKKGLYNWLKESDPDVLCLQETKAQKEQLTEKFINQAGYTSYWSSAVKKGYSGVVVYTKEIPLEVSFLNKKEYDDEGRFLALHFPKYTFIGAYFPNSQAEGKRIDYKVGFCRALKDYADAEIKNDRRVVICGDYNIAHKPIDLANPKRNEKNPGYLPEERAWMDEFIDGGYTDTFREFDKGPDNYTWWSYRFNGREKNIGWRIDYFCVNDAIKKNVKSSTIEKETMGSDHCPINITMKL